MSQVPTIDPCIRCGRDLTFQNAFNEFGWETMHVVLTTCEFCGYMERTTYDPERYFEERAEWNDWVAEHGLPVKEQFEVDSIVLLFSTMLDNVGGAADVLELWAQQHPAMVPREKGVMVDG